MSEDWESWLADNPKVLWGLVADVVKAAKADEGEKRTGRRPAASCASMEELYEVLFPPAYSTKPFAVAFTGLLREKEMSQRDIARVSPINQATISRLVAGPSATRPIPLTTELIEAIAVALDVRPTYFAEYRAMRLGQAITEVLIGQPALSADSMRRLFLAGAPA